MSKAGACDEMRGDSAVQSMPFRAATAGATCLLVALRHTGALSLSAHHRAQVDLGVGPVTSQQSPVHFARAQQGQQTRRGASCLSAAFQGLGRCPDVLQLPCFVPAWSVPAWLGPGTPAIL